jgi:hypothetical protein
LQHDLGNAGGNWNNTSNAGLGYRNANNERTNSNNNIGFRPALPLSARSSFLTGDDPRQGKGINVLARPN